MPWLVASVTFVVFSAEALLHYNIGKNGHTRVPVMPKPRDAVQMLIIVAVFSIINGYIIKYLQGFT